jgi:general secretion pathway protein G
MRKKAAFIGVALIALALLAVKVFVPSLVTSRQEAAEVTLQQDVLTMHYLISQYTLDLHRRPHRLEDLVVSGYLKELPLDPMTKRRDTWIVKCSNDRAAPGIVSIDSGRRVARNEATTHCD